MPLESALIYLNYKMESRAQARARTAVEMAPDQYYCWYVCGCAQAALDFRRQAKESFDQCLKLCPRHADALARSAALDGGGGLLSRTIRRLLKRS